MAVELKHLLKVKGPLESWNTNLRSEETTHQGKDPRPLGELRRSFSIAATSSRGGPAGPIRKGGITEKGQGAF